MDAGRGVSGEIDKGPYRVVFGSRKSQLAQWQTQAVGQALKRTFAELDFSVISMSTQGDRQIDQPLPEIGGKGLFTAELDRALLAKEIDVAVHSLKDLPTDPTPGLVIIPVLRREDPRDVLISRDHITFADLPQAATVGTSSYRRQAQLLACRPDIKVLPIRGNVPTRISKVKESLFDAVILAAAGINRLGKQASITEAFAVETMLPAPGQAAVAATCRVDDLNLRSRLTTLADRETVICVNAERKLLHLLGGGCSAPVGSLAQCAGGEKVELTLTGKVVSLDGRHEVTCQRSGEDPHAVAAEVARGLLDDGADRILQSLKKH